MLHFFVSQKCRRYCYADTPSAFLGVLCSHLTIPFKLEDRVGAEAVLRTQPARSDLQALVFESVGEQVGVFLDKL
jgi:hypothetical protein